MACRRLPNVKATILDVARRAGVSAGTVSYVLNGTKAVSEARREQVLAAVHELDYMPNRLAQGLRRGRSRLVGICVPSVNSGLFGRLADAVEGIAASKGFEVAQVLSHQDPELECRRLSALLAHRLAGLLLVPSARSGASLELITREGLPTVILDRPTEHRRFDEITIDNKGAMRDVVARLISLGHRRLLYIVSFPHLITTRHRIDAFRRAARGCGLPISAEVMQRGRDESEFGARLAGAMCHRDHPTALIASNSLIGLWMIRTLQKLELSWPRDVSLLAFEHPDWADILQPPLSVVEHPTEQMARLAWDMLEQRMQDADAPPRRIELQARVVQRASMGSCPAPRGASPPVSRRLSDEMT